jgi:zinc/manganese transport system ATP-binding protein
MTTPGTQVPGDGDAVVLDHVYTAYEGADHPTLRDISLTIRKGEYVIVGGPNGAGKTTLLETINGMLKITHGSATICGLPLAGDGVHVRKRVGYLIQNFAFSPLTPFTVRDVVLMGRFGILGLFTRPGEQDFRAAEEAMESLGIADLADVPIGHLSGGQQQKALIAHNLAKKPQVLLLDEPFSNLDLFARERISRLLGALAGQGMTIITVSHAFDDLPDRPIRILVMNDGRLCHDSSCAPGEVGARVRAASVAS